MRSQEARKGPQVEVGGPRLLVFFIFKNLGILIGRVPFIKIVLPIVIHPEGWIPRIPESADNFNFSTERLSENAKTINITLFAELLAVISP